MRGSRKFCQRGQTLTTFLLFFSPIKMAFRLRAYDDPTLNLTGFVIIQGIRASTAKKP